MGMTGMEAVLTAVESTLSSNMNAKITALNAEYGDGISCSNITTYEWYKKNFAAQDYPVCVLDAVQSLPDERYTDGAVERHGVIVFVAETDSNAENLIKKIMRYARAVKEILTTNYALGGVSHSVGYMGTEYSPTFTDKERKYLKAVAIEFEVYKEEVV
jgi:hypothetical protein